MRCGILEIFNQKNDILDYKAHNFGFDFMYIYGDYFENNFWTMFSIARVDLTLFVHFMGICVYKRCLR